MTLDSLVAAGIIDRKIDKCSLDLVGSSQISSFDATDWIIEAYGSLGAYSGLPIEKLLSDPAVLADRVRIYRACVEADVPVLHSGNVWVPAAGDPEGTLATQCTHRLLLPIPFEAVSPKNETQHLLLNISCFDEKRSYPCPEKTSTPAQIITEAVLFGF